MIGRTDYDHRKPTSREESRPPADPIRRKEIALGIAKDCGWDSIEHMRAEVRQAFSLAHRFS